MRAGEPFAGYDSETSFPTATVCRRGKADLLHFPMVFEGFRITVRFPGLYFFLEEQKPWFSIGFTRFSVDPRGAVSFLGIYP